MPATALAANLLSYWLSFFFSCKIAGDSCGVRAAKEANDGNHEDGSDFLDLVRSFSLAISAARRFASPIRAPNAYDQIQKRSSVRSTTVAQCVFGWQVNKRIFVIAAHLQCPTQIPGGDIAVTRRV